MSYPMKIRATLSGDKVEVKALIAHEMETGFRKDTAGTLVPAHYIQLVTIQCNGKSVLSAQWGPSVSKNPFLTFRFSGAKKGEKLNITWQDNLGETRSDEVAIT